MWWWQSLLRRASVASYCPWGQVETLKCALQHLPGSGPSSLVQSQECFVFQFPKQSKLSFAPEHLFPLFPVLLYWLPPHLCLATSIPQVYPPHPSSWCPALPPVVVLTTRHLITCLPICVLPLTITFPKDWHQCFVVQYFVLNAWWTELLQDSVLNKRISKRRK